MGIDPGRLGMAEDRPAAPAAAAAYSNGQPQPRPSPPPPSQTGAHPIAPGQRPPVPDGPAPTGYHPVPPSGPVTYPPADPGTGHYQPSARHPRAAASLAVPAGLRRSVRAARHGLVPGAAQTDEEELIRRIRATPGRAQTIAFLGLKGGVGKTTLTALTGVVLASLRPFPVVAFDANPDAGTLINRLSPQPALSLADLVERSTGVGALHPAEVLPRGSGGVHLCAATTSYDPVDMPGPDDIAAGLQLLNAAFPTTLVDCGTDISRPFMAHIVPTAHSLVVAAAPTYDSARAADATLDWLADRGMHGLLDRMVVVLSSMRDTKRDRSLETEMLSHFGRRAASAIHLPFDPALVRGGVIDPAELSPRTRETALRLAALLVG